MIVYVRFPSTERMKIVDHYLFCLLIGIDTTALSVFSKSDNYFSEHEVMWSKCKSVSTDGARAMVGVRSGVVALITQVFNITTQGCGIDIFEATSKLHHSNKNLKVWKKKSAVTTYKI